MAKRPTRFNPDWKNEFSWVDSVPGDIYRAYCKLCKKSFSIAGQGYTKVKDHIKNLKHVESEKINKQRNSASSIARFMTGMF